MPLYQLHCIAAHYPEYKHIKDLVTRSATLLLDRGSVVREIKYLGTRNLPQRMRRHKHHHTTGDYWSMRFDASPATMLRLSHQLRDDPRVVRWGTLSLGSSLDKTSLTSAPRRTVTEHDPLHAALTNLGSSSGAGSSILSNFDFGRDDFSPQTLEGFGALGRRMADDEALAFARDSQYMYGRPPSDP